MRHALYEPVGYGVRDVKEDNGDLRGRPLGSSRRLIFERDDEIHSSPDELLSRLTGSFLVWQVSPISTEILPLFISQNLQPFSQRLQGGRDMIEAHMKETDPVHLARLLRVSGERRHEDGEDEDGYSESTTCHRSRIGRRPPCGSSLRKRPASRRELVPAPGAASNRVTEPPSLSLSTGCGPPNYQDSTGRPRAMPWAQPLSAAEAAFR